MKPVSTSSSVTSTSSPASPTSEAFNRGGFDSDGNQPPPLFYDTSDESDYDPTGLLTPVSINLEYEREWQREQNRYQQEREIRKAQYQRAKEAEAALAAKKARAGIYMRTRAGIFKNEKDLSGWDGCFCYLDRRGKIEITESVWAYVMVIIRIVCGHAPGPSLMHRISDMLTPWRRTGRVLSRRTRRPRLSRSRSSDRAASPAKCRKHRAGGSRNLGERENHTENRGSMSFNTL